LIEEVGRGGAAIVFRAQGADGRDVALKLLQPQEQEDFTRFVREQKVHASLGAREGFVPLIATGQSPQGPYLVMPFLRGGTLRDRMDAGAMEVDEAVPMLRMIAQTVGRAHALGIVHRDLKPENVLFSSDGRPYVSDLGLAKHYVKDAPNRQGTITQLGDFFGSVGYMAPEQVGDSPVIAAPADVFALGAILYECLAGRPAFSGESPFAVIKTVAIDGIEPLASIRPDVPRWLSDTVRRSLLRFPKDRFADANAFAHALDPPPDPNQRIGRR
jgi:serine/threonine protein kinase